MSRDSLTRRVGELLRGTRHLPAPLTDREARDQLLPHGCGLDVLPADMTVNPRAPLGPENLDGARGDQILSGAGDSTS